MKGASFRSERNGVARSGSGDKGTNGNGSQQQQKENAAGLRVSVELLQCSPASLSLLESTRAAAKARLERGLLCTRTRKGPARGSAASLASTNYTAGGTPSVTSGENGIGGGGSGQDMTYLLDSNRNSSESNRDESHRKNTAEDGNDSNSGNTDESRDSSGATITSSSSTPSSAMAPVNDQQPLKSQAVEPAPVQLIDGNELSTSSNSSTKPVSRGPITWFDEPYVNVIMTACGDMDDHRKLRPKLKAILDAAMNEVNSDTYSGQPMLVVHVIPPCTEAVARIQRRIYERLRDDAAVKRGVLCCK